MRDGGYWTEGTKWCIKLHTFRNAIIFSSLSLLIWPLGVIWDSKNSLGDYRNFSHDFQRAIYSRECDKSYYNMPSFFALLNKPVSCFWWLTADLHLGGRVINFLYTNYFCRRQSNGKNAKYSIYRILPSIRFLNSKIWSI